MSVEISQGAIRKLTHDSKEIRIRALEQIETKFTRALCHQLDIDLNAVDLCKQLIRWFNFKPLQTPERVLQLLTRLLLSKHGGVAIDAIGIARLKTELKKLKKLLQNKPEELKDVDSLLNLLSDRERLGHIREAESDVVELVETLSLKSNENLTENQLYAAHDCEYVWSRPTTADYNSLKFLSNVLSSRLHAVDEINNALQHLQITMSDYPAEYMLQSPHIFWNLLRLFGETELDDRTLNYTIAALSTFLVILKERLLQRRKVDNYSIPARGVPGLYCSQNAIKTKSQLKVQKAMDLLLEKLLKHLAMHAVKIRIDILHIMKATAMILDIFHLQHLSVSTQLLQLTFQIREQFQNEYFQDDCHLNLARGQYLWLTFVLHEMAEINVKRSQLLGQHKFLEATMCDFTLQKSFPKRHKEIKTLLSLADPQLEQTYEPLDRWKTSIEAAIILLKQETIGSSPEPVQLLTHADAVVYTLDAVNSLRLVNLIFSAILECIPMYLSKSDLKAQAMRLLCHLLNLKQPALRAFVHQHVSIAVKKHFAALMNGECYCPGVQNRALLSSLIIGIPMDVSVLEHLIYQCHESDNDTIREHAADTLLLLLRARRFYEASWETFLDVLLPVLPLIQGLQISANPLREAILKLLDPDSAQVPFITLLRGNIGLLFTSDAGMRNEALTRLIYMLNLLPESTAYIPNIMEISDTLPNDLCVLQTPRKFRQVFAATETYYESSTLYNLLTLLDSADIEPGVRKSTIMQLNVMLKSWELTAAFCELEAHCLLLRVLENSLQKASSIDYIESIVPAVSIVAKLLIYDSSFRQELCSIPNVYVLLLRALFYFSQDVNVRQDVSICLFLLHFGSYIVVPRGGGHLIAPAVFGNLKCPLACELQSSATHETHPEDLQRVVRNVFANEKQWAAYMRQLIADAYFEGASLTKREVEQLQSALDICPSFLLNPHDVRLAKATDTTQSIRVLLRTISNATDEKTLVKASNSLQSHLILFTMENRGTSQLSPELANAIFSTLSKYLQVTPGNATDFEVYACVLDLFHLCVRQQLQPVGQNLLNILRSDFHHGMIVMLQNSELPIDFMNKLSLFLADLFAAPLNNVLSENKRIRDSALRSNLFELLQSLMLGYYAKRELQKVRCMQRIMCVLSTPTLMLPMNKIYDCRKSLLRLSIGIGSTTQTGAQWHRNILAIYSQLFVQLSDDQKANVSSNTLKHLVGLAGHNDTTVRALAWLCLCQVAGLEGSQRSQSADSITAASSGAQILAKKIMHLPGGLIGCCLSTFLDSGEIPTVRHFAASIFVTLLHENCTFEQALVLLTQHSFFSVAHSSLQNCVFDQLFPLHSPYVEAEADFNDCAATNDEEERPSKFVTCDLIGCYCRICFELIQKNADFADELCEKPLLFKLYELLKLPPTEENPAYYNMCAHICQLYAGCANRNLVFLQRVLCHDERWLLCFFQLLKPPSQAPDACVVYVLQLLLSLLPEDFVYQKLCTYLADNVDVVQKLFQRALNVCTANRSLQSCALSLLTLLLIKSQLQPATDALPEESCVPNFALVIETKIAVASGSTTKTKTAAPEEDKENTILSCNTLKSKALNKRKKPPHEAHRKMEQVEKEEEFTVSQLLLIELHRLFCHFYPSNTCKFEINPSPAKVQICESLSILLKTSPHACKAANNLKLFDNILHILTMFVQELNTSCTDFVRRYGESKKLAVVRNLQVIFQVLLNWFSPTGAILTDELHCCDLSKILIQIWPWLAHSASLRELVIKLLAFLSERSLLLCRQFSTLISSYAHSILQLVIKLAISETQKMKTSNASAVHVPIVSLALRVMTNCSACGEGRFTLVKEHALDIFDGLHPLNPKSPKVRAEVLQHWLQFWELFSRYNEGGQARNLNALCDVIQRSTPCSAVRLLCLKILRNMCFVAHNRTLFISSTHFIHTIDEIVGQPISSGNSAMELVSYEEQFIACICLWQIVAGGVKYVARVRGSKLISKMHILRDKLSVTSEQMAEQPNDSTFRTDLANVLDIIFTVFND